MRNFIFFFFLVVLTSSILGCSSTVTKKKRLQWYGNTNSLLTTADVRSINSVRPERFDEYNGKVIPKFITCAEPSPDVAKAISTALSAAAEVVGNTKGVEGNAALALGLSYSEGIAQLGERLATIQLLRDGLYRACEAYQNGAITASTYAIILGSVDDLIVTTLLGELAAGAFGRDLAAIGSESGSTNSVDSTNKSNGEEHEEDNEEEETSSTKTTVKTEETIEANPESVSGDENVEEKKEKETSITTVTRNLSSNPTTKIQATAGGQIEGREADAAVAAILLKMQSNYLNRVDVDSFAISCISSITYNPASAYSQLCMNGNISKSVIESLNKSMNPENVATTNQIPSVEINKICNGRECIDAGILNNAQSKMDELIEIRKSLVSEQIKGTLITDELASLNDFIVELEKINKLLKGDSEKLAKINKLNQQIKAKKEEVGFLNSDLVTKTRQIATIEQQIQQLDASKDQAKINQKRKEQKAISDKIDELVKPKEGKIDKAKAELGALEKELNNLKK